MVLKPAELVPGSAWILADIISRSGLPAGAFNLVMGSGRDVGETLCTSPDIQAVTFTGSVGVGRHIARNAIDNMARVQLEMGSKNALVVLDDADMDVAVNCALAGGYFGTGQKCTASSRIIVQAGIHDAFVEKLSAAVSNWSSVMLWVKAHRLAQWSMPVSCTESRVYSDRQRRRRRVTSGW